MTAAYHIDVEERSERIRLRQTAGQIGAGLRLLFQEMTGAPVPEAWLELLRRADRRAAGRT